MATHSSVLTWRIPGTGEPGGLPSMGSHRVGHDWSDLAAAAAAWQLYSHQEPRLSVEASTSLSRMSALDQLLICLPARIQQKREDGELLPSYPGQAHCLICNFVIFAKTLFPNEVIHRYGAEGLDTCLMYIPLANTLSYDHTYFVRKAGKYMTTLTLQRRLGNIIFLPGSMCSAKGEFCYYGRSRDKMWTGSNYQSLASLWNRREVGRTQRLKERQRLVRTD